MWQLRTQINHLQSKNRFRIGFLFRNRASFTHSAKLVMVKMTIVLILDFSDVIYKNVPNFLLKKLDVVYHSAILFVTRASYNTHRWNL